MKPSCRGYDEGGAPGLVSGAYRGLMGALVRPLAYMLETSAKVAENVTAAVVGVPEIAPRVRPPRFVPAAQALPPYDWSEVPLSASFPYTQPLSGNRHLQLRIYLQAFLEEPCTECADHLRTKEVRSVFTHSLPVFINAAMRLSEPLPGVQAIGRYLLGEVSGGRHSAEEFLICRQQSDGPIFVLVTSQHYLSISSPGLRFFPAVN